MSIINEGLEWVTLSGISNWLKKAIVQKRVMYTQLWLWVKQVNLLPTRERRTRITLSVQGIQIVTSLTWFLNHHVALYEAL